MKAVIKAVVLAAVCATLHPTAPGAAGSPAVAAQWPTHPTRGVPKTADGKPNLEAPAPRTADGKIDLSGVWRGGGAAGRGAAPAAPSDVPVAAFRDVGAAFKDGLPLTPFGAELLKTRRAGNSKDNPEAHCLPMGILQFHTQGAPRRFVQTPDLLVVLYEASMGQRQIYTDGRTLPKQGDPQPFWYGYSAGRWEGDTLVVETNNFRDDGWLDIVGSPLTDAATLTERFRRVSYGRMEIDITVNDPKAYTRPWTVRHNQQILLDEDLIEFVCLENQRFGKQ
jgi:hypothetical protein